MKFEEVNETPELEESTEPSSVTETGEIPEDVFNGIEREKQIEELKKYRQELIDFKRIEFDEDAEGDKQKVKVLKRRYNGGRRNGGY